MFQYGGTIGPAQYPTYKTDLSTDQKHMLPRPVVKSRPGQLGHRIMNKCQWLVAFCKDVEKFTVQHLFQHRSQSTESVWNHIQASKRLIPPCLRICNTFFTQMIVVGSPSSTTGSIPPHLDSNDHVNALVSFGDTEEVEGGDTFYIEKDTDGLIKIRRRISFCHGNLQIGIYNDVLHGATPWKNGLRGVVNFSLQRKVLQHFYTHGNTFYQQYIDKGYPSGDFVAVP